MAQGLAGQTIERAGRCAQEHAIVPASYGRPEGRLGKTDLLKEGRPPGVSNVCVVRREVYVLALLKSWLRRPFSE
jgi:hypothetical protein